MNRFTELLYASLLALSLVGCSALAKLGLDAISGSTGGGVSAEAQVGDRENNVTAGDSDNSSRVIEGENVSTTETITNIIDEAPSPFVLLLLVLGWILPGPGRTWAGLIKLVGKMRGEK